MKQEEAEISPTATLQEQTVQTCNCGPRCAAHLRSDIRVDYCRLDNILGILLLERLASEVRERSPGPFIHDADGWTQQQQKRMHNTISALVAGFGAASSEYNTEKTATHRARTERGSNGLNVILTFVTRPSSGTSVTERNARDAMLNAKNWQRKEVMKGERRIELRRRKNNGERAAPAMS